MTTEVLEMIFLNTAGAKYTIQLPFPKTGLTGSEIADVMDTIIAKNIFESKMLPLTQKHSARIVTREVTEFNIE